MRDNPHIRVTRGFTLVELLVVVAIICLLATIGISVMGGVIGAARKAATKATLTKINTLLDARRAALGFYFTRKKTFEKDQPILNKSFPVPPATAQQSPTKYASQDGKIAEIICRKVVNRRYLPQTWREAVEILTAAGEPLNPAGDAPARNRTDPLIPNESSEVLYYVLINSPVSGYDPGGVDFTTSEVRDLDGDGLNEFVDAWNQPLRFYRWPTGLVRPTGGASYDRALADLLIDGLPQESTSRPQALSNDPDDIGGKLSPPWNDSLGNAVTVSRFESEFHTLKTYHTPVVISSGPDLTLGLGEPTVSGLGRLATPLSSSTDPSLFDNLSNRNIGLGVK